jgi:hypothetical protein
VSPMCPEQTVTYVSERSQNGINGLQRHSPPDTRGDVQHGRDLQIHTRGLDTQVLSAYVIVHEGR